MVDLCWSNGPCKLRKPCMLCWKPSHFFRVCERFFLFAKVRYYEPLSLYTLQLVKGYHLLPPGARGLAGEWYTTFSFPFIGSSQASEGEALREPNTKAPGVCCSSDAPPCWWLGSVDRGIFAKVPWKFCEGLGESQSAFWREWPSKPCKKNA